MQAQTDCAGTEEYFQGQSTDFFGGSGGKVIGG